MADIGLRGSLVRLALGSSALAISAGLGASAASAATFTVNSTADGVGAGTLRWAINQANATAGADTIVFDAGLAGSVTIDIGIGDLPALVEDVTIDMGGKTLDANGNRGFFAYSGTVVIENGTIANAEAKGGEGGYGGGGAGMGGALFVAENADVTVRSVTFSNNRAEGGDAPSIAIAGGGMGGDSGNSNANAGGGGIGSQAGGGANSDDGGPGIVTGAAGGGDAGTNDGGPNGGGGANYGGGSGGGGGGGIGGQAGSGPVPGAQHGGNGGFGGGGGGGGLFDGNGGNGGFGGGGGGARYNLLGGDGGYGGGGGFSSNAGNEGAGGFGGGNAASGPGSGKGGGGAGMGGAIFVMEGGSLKIEGATSLSGSTVGVGNSATGVDGRAFGSAMYLHGSGTLEIGNITGTQTVAGNIVDETGLINGGYAWVGNIDGRAAGSWGLSVDAGSGTVHLTGIASRFSGGLTITSGTVAFDDEGGLGDAAGGMTIDGGTLEDADGGGLDDVNHDIVVGAGGATFKVNSTRLTGAISGAGAITVEAPIFLQLTGTNTYGGATDIVSGLLMVEGGSAIPDTSRVTVAAGATLRLYNDETIGSLAGAGTVQADVLDRTLTVGADGTSSADFSGVLEDTALVLSLAKSGAGTQTLSGTNTYTGATTVNAGTLAVNGSIATSSGVTVGTGAFLGGVGTVAPVTIQSGGTLAPGNSIGTLTVNGSLTFAPGSTYAVEVSPAAADRTNVVAVGGAGMASLTGATVAASYAGGTYVQKQYVILNAAGGLGGTTFAGLTGTAPTGTSHALSYDGNNAYLDLTLLMAGGGDSGSGGSGGGGDSGGGGGGGSDGGSGGSTNPFANLNANQQAVADTIVRHFNTSGALPAAFAALDPAGLTAVAGETGAAGQQAGMVASDHFLDAISDPLLEGGSAGQGGGSAAAFAPERSDPAAERFGRLSYAAEELSGGLDPATRALRLQHSVEAGFGDAAPKTERYSVWGAALGGGVNHAGDPATGSQALSGSVYGLASGFDWLNGGTRAGFALGASWSNAAVAGLGTASTGSASAGIRASHDFGRLYIAGAAAYGLHFGATTRVVFGETYTAAYTAQSLSARAEAGWRFRTRAVDLAPFLAARVISLSTRAYTEAGAGAGTFALAYNAASALEARSELGLRLHRTVSHASGGATSFSGMLGWAHYFSRGGSASAGFAALPGTQFVTQGARGGSDTALVSLGVSHRFANGLGLSFSADGELGAGTTSFGGKAGLSIKW
jgi:autotransporter-associated beta strand protein